MKMTSQALDLRELALLLVRCVSDVGRSVERMDLGDIRLALFGYCLAEDGVRVEIRPRILPALKPDAALRIGSHKPETKRRFRPVSSDGCLSRKESVCSPPPLLKLTRSIWELNIHALNSGAVLFPGCTDREHRPTVILHCQNEFWIKNDEAQISKIIDYFYYITRDSVRSNGIALLVDARKATRDRIESVITVISSLEACVQKVLSAIYLFVDCETSYLLLASKDLPAEVVAKVFTFESHDSLFEEFDESQIPMVVGGSMTFNLKKWVDYRRTMESFVHDCFTAANRLMPLGEAMTQADDLPRSVREAEVALLQHSETVRETLDDELLRRLCDTGKSSLESIAEVEEEFSNSRDLCSDAAETSAGELFEKLQSSVVQLTALASERQQKLEGCLQLRQFEEHASQMINKLCTEWEDLLAKYGCPGDNLRSAKLQLLEFNKSIEQFKELVAKGKDVLEEASVLTDLGICDELTGIREVCRELRSCMTSYAARMDGVRETLGNTTRCYLLLDQSFEWTLKTMKFVVDMKLEREMTLAEVERSKSQLEVFMTEHPPLPLEIFAQMERLLSGLSNQRLSEQWAKANGHYVAIDALVRQRYATLVLVFNKATANCSDGNETRSEAAMLGETTTDSEIKTQAVTSAGLSGEDLKLQIEIGRSSFLRSKFGTDLPSRPVDASLDRIPPGADGAHCSPVLAPSVCAHANERPDVSGVDLDVCIPCSGSECGLIKRIGLDDVFSPQLSPLEGNDVSKPLVKYSSSAADFSQPSNIVYRRSHSSNACPTIAFADSRPVSQAFDVSEYMLKDSLPNVEPRSNEIRPWFSQSTLPGPSCEELVSHRPPSGVVYASHSCLPSSARNGGPDRRHASLPAAPSPSSNCVRNTKPSWKGLRKVFSSLADRDLNLKKHFFRRSSSDFSANAVEANSTESLPGRLEEGAEGDGAPPVDLCHRLLSKEETMHRKYGWSQVPSNSHMIFSNRLALASHSQSVGDIRLSSDGVKKNRVLSLIVRELTMTESDYINSLDYVITNYIPELLCEDMTQSLCGKKNVIFGNIERIFEFHSQTFLAKLLRCQNSPFQLGACFLQHESEFYLYALYNKNKPKADILMEEFGSKYFQRKQRELNDRMDLNSYLLKPVQRMGKYALLLRQIIKECPESHPDYPDLQAALEMGKFQLRHGNDLLAMDSLRDCDVNLQEQGLLLRQHEFLVFHGRRKCVRQVFLFEELVVFGKARRSSCGHDIYIYKNSIKTSDLGLTESVGESGCRFELWFRKRIPGMTYVVQSLLPDVKQQWVDDISQLLWKQTLRNRERKMAEMACMGVGAKPSLDLKRSKDNINDRFVNISPSEQRNRPMRPKSVSLSSPCHDGWRPHSLISVSSVSSSGSSYSSGYGSCLSSGFGAIAGALATTEESPLEYIQLPCEEATSPADVEAKNSTLDCMAAFAEAHSMDDSQVVMDLNASHSNDSGFVERGCVTTTLAEERSDAKKPEGGVFSSHSKEDACTQTTLERPHKTLSLKATAPIASLESDSDDFY